jgi:cytochrome b561
VELTRRYHPALVTLHWLMVLLVFVNLYLGIFIFEDSGGGRGDSQDMNFYVAIHMLVGLTILALLVVRFILKVATRKPAPATAGNPLLDLLAGLVHSGIYLAVLAVTLLGLVFSVQSGRFQSTFLGAESSFTAPADGFPRDDDDNSGPGSGENDDDDDNSGPGSGGDDDDGDNSGPGSGSDDSTDGSNSGPGRGGGRDDDDGPGGFDLLEVHELAAYALLSLVSLHILAVLYHQFIRRDNLIARMWYGPG